jgi:hypothetical protein
VAMAGELPDVGAFGAAFSEFVEAMSGAARARESGLVARTRERLGANPRELPSTSAEFSPTDHPNLQLALDAVLPDAEVIGISAANPGVMMLGLSALLSGHAMVGPLEPGPERVVSGLISQLRAAMREHNVYRGQVISLHGDEGGPDHRSGFSSTDWRRSHATRWSCPTGRSTGSSATRSG